MIRSCVRWVFDKPESVLRRLSSQVGTWDGTRTVDLQFLLGWYFLRAAGDTSSPSTNQREDGRVGQLVCQVSCGTLQHDIRR